MGGCENRYIFVTDQDIEFENHPATGKKLGDHEFGPIFELLYNKDKCLDHIPVFLGNFNTGAYIDYITPDRTPTIDLIVASLFNGEIYIEDFIAFLADIYGELLDCEKIASLLFINKTRNIQDVLTYVRYLDELKINKILDEIKKAYKYEEH